MTKKTGYIAATSLFTLAAGMQWLAATQEEKVVDSVRNLLTVSAYLGDICTSKERRTIENCTAAIMGSTVGVANALGSYLDKHYPDNDSSRVLAAGCSTSFNTIFLTHKYMVKVYGHDRVTNSFLNDGLSGSRRCLQTITNVADEYRLNYMPSLMSFLYRKINDAENGNFVIGWHA